MANLTLSVPEELKKKMEDFQEINWSAVAREAFNEKIRDILLIRKFKSKSIFTDSDAIKLGSELSQRLAERRK